MPCKFQKKQTLGVEIREEIQNQIDYNSFETWFEPTVYIGQESNALYIKVPNSYFKDWLSFHYSKPHQQLF